MRLAEFILNSQEAILAEWEAFAATLNPAAASMTLLALRDDAAQILEAVAADLATSQTRDAQAEKSKGRAPKVAEAPETAAQTHAVLRARNGFDINQLVAEYRALRASVLLWIDTSCARSSMRTAKRSRCVVAAQKPLSPCVCRAGNRKDRRSARELPPGGSLASGYARGPRWRPASAQRSSRLAPPELQAARPEAVTLMLDRCAVEAGETNKPWARWSPKRRPETRLVFIPPGTKNGDWVYHFSFVIVALTTRQATAFSRVGQRSIHYSPRCMPQFDGELSAKYSRQIWR